MMTWEDVNFAQRMSKAEIEDFTHQMLDLYGEDEENDDINDEVDFVRLALGSVTSNRLPSPGVRVICVPKCSIIRSKMKLVV